jgi:hypothetical protein
VNALLLLQLLDHLEQVARLGITFWPEHAHEALARLAEYLGEFLDSDRCVDIVKKRCVAGSTGLGLVSIERRDVLNKVVFTNTHTSLHSDQSFTHSTCMNSIAGIHSAQLIHFKGESEW